MWIEILLLSRLAREPMHGYDLRKVVEASTGRTLSNNSLYPALRRFVDAGAVTRSAEDREVKPPRHVYTITAVGREMLHDMLADFPEELALNDEEFLARVGNFSWLRDEERAVVLDTRQRAIVAEHHRLTVLATRQADPWSRAVLDEIGRRFTDEQAWLEQLRSAVHPTTNPGEGHDRYRQRRTSTALRPAQRAGDRTAVRPTAQPGATEPGGDTGR
ncbi:MAG TPA: PadR family transcriptional regulator [Rugosimonospora sp.]|nr:PadR family transcriptional regulator [Rugosimonospora sp.]